MPLMWLHVVVAVTFKTGQPVSQPASGGGGGGGGALDTGHISWSIYPTRGLTGGEFFFSLSLLEPHVLIVTRAQIDSVRGTNK